jgi:ATP-binding cassette subfamily B protein
LQAQASNQGRSQRLGGPGGRPGSNANIPKNRGLQRSLAYLGHYKNTVILAYVALIVATLSQLAVPQLLQNILTSLTNGFVAQKLLALPGLFQTAAIQSYINSQKLGLTVDAAKLKLADDAANAQNAIIVAALVIVGFAVMRAVFSFIQTYMSEKNSQGVAFDLRNALFAKLQRLSFSYYDQNQTGQLMIRATDDIEKVRLFIGQGLLIAIQAIILIVGALLLLLTNNWQLTLVILPILPISLALSIAFGALAFPLFAKVQIRLSRMNTILQENLAGIRVVKAFAREPQEQAKFNTAADALMQQQIAVARAFTVLFPLTFLVANIGQAVILYFSGRQIISGDLSSAQYQTFSLYLLYIFLPLSQLGFIISLAAQAVPSAARIFEILDAKNEVTDKPGALPLPSVEGTVEFKDVTFSYFGSTDPVLKRVSFTAKPGQTVALLGATGSGKTTIINLLPRFYDVTSGQVLIDGKDVRDVTLDSLRKQIGIVLQETNLFSGTIRDNIAFGRPEASLEDVVNAAKAAAADDFIQTFPQGYDTPVGERGTTLSGGQKQRIAIARALLLDPHILILDDSTSSVDLTTESKIQAALDRLMKGRTSFVIAQRISTVVNADQILVLDKGQVVASGTHKDLMNDSAIYAEIYNSQLVGDTTVDAIETPATLNPASALA